MHHEDIKAAIRKKGVTSAQLAKHLGVTEQTVSGVIRGVTKSTRIAKAIGQLTGLGIEVMWPHLFGTPTPTATTILKSIGVPATPKRARNGAAKKRSGEAVAADEIRLIEPQPPRSLGRQAQRDGPSSHSDRSSSKSERSQ